MLNFDFDGKKPHMYEVIDRILIQRKENLDNAILGVIKEIIDGNECLTTVELNETAIVNALKKQIPRKPLPIAGDYDLPICPECKQLIDDTEFYCSTCGQAIDWNGPLTHNSKRKEDEE